MTSKTPYISAVITSYNRPAYLHQALASVLAQTKSPDQVIIVDDGSDEALFTEIKQVVEKAGRSNAMNIKSIELSRLGVKQGANAARNKGVQMAKGHIVAFLDDDDCWHANFLSKHIDAYVDNTEVSGVVCGKRIMGKTKTLINANNIVTEASLRMGNQYCGMSGVSMKRDVLLKHPLDESLSNGQDWDLFVRVVCANHLLVNIGEALYDYRKNTPQSISTVTKNMTIADSEQRLASSYKHRTFLGEHYFKIRVADQLLTFILNKPDKGKWLIKCIKIAGIKITIKTLFGKLFR